MKRGPLSATPELQKLLVLLVAMGESSMRTATALVATRFVIEDAAKLLPCAHCDGAGNQRTQRLCEPCDSCGGTGRLQAAALRARVYRLQQRVQDVMGVEFHLTPSRRARMSFGADAKGIYATHGVMMQPGGEDEA